MTNRLTPLSSIAGLDQAIRESFVQPVLIFKHSHTCGISAQAFDQVRDWLGQASVDGPSYVVTVQSDRAIAQEIASRLGVRHESPQALVIRDGRVAWHASHFRVTPDAIEQELVKQV